VTPIEIRSGLRRLEFKGPTDAATPSDDTHALVEFVRPEPLGPEDAVRIVLGTRDGLLRELIGQPRLVDTRQAPRGAAEYYYQLHGLIAVSRP
jgi:hypothetical protein